MIKIKEYPPVISVATIIEDRLVGAKSYPTVVKRLKELGVAIHIYEMVRTSDLFAALIPDETMSPQQAIKSKRKFKLR